MLRANSKMACAKIEKKERERESVYVFVCLRMPEGSVCVCVFERVRLGKKFACLTSYKTDFAPSPGKKKL